MILTNASRPQTLQQFGGVCHHLLEDKDILWICRTGGLEVVTWGASLQPLAFLPLSKIPVAMTREQQAIRLHFRTRSFLARLEDGVIQTTEDQAFFPPPLQPPRTTIPTFGGILELVPGPNNGLIFRTQGNESKTIPLSGYSRPQALIPSNNSQFAYVADIGIVRRLHVRNGAVSETSGFGRPGWPKDVRTSKDGQYLFAANVFGLELYSRSSTAGRIALVDSFQRPHFRIAKVRLLDDLLLACDEARGLHIFEWQQGLRVRGGIILPGGAWDVAIQDDDILVACGPEGLVRLSWDRNAGRLTERDRVQIPGNSLGVMILGSTFFVFGSKGVFSGTLHPAGLALHSDFIPCTPCWSAVHRQGAVFVAAGRSGVLAIAPHPAGPPALFQTYKTLEARDICCLSNETMVVADGRGGISFLSFDKQSPTISQAWVYPVPGFCRGITCHDSSIYVGAGDGGLVHISIPRASLSKEHSQC